MSDCTLTFVAGAVPKFTPEVHFSPVPVIVTLVPPVAGPVVGLMLLTVGGMQ